MPSFSEQFAAARISHLAASTVEDIAREQISQAFAAWNAGLLDAQTVRHRLEAVVRSAYRSSSEVAAQAAQRAGKDIPGWKPVSVFNNDYLQSLLKDVRRNLREYKASERTEADLRRAVLYTQHSAGVGAQRGYTDSLIASYEQMENLGYEVIKAWLANFENNTPCVHCRELHGKMVGLKEVFKVPTKTLKVYLDLLGPPRHPRCRCYLAILVVTLENAFEEIDPIVPPTPSPRTMTTEEVKKIPLKIFTSVLNVLKKIRKGLKRKT